MTDEKKSSDRISGCSFSLYPMSDQYADLILNSLKKIDTSKVWLKTDAVSTIVRGRIPHIFDVAQAAFLETANSGEHVVLSGTFSIGCPGDTAGHAFMSEDDNLANQSVAETINQKVVAKFALYPMGGGDYMDVIYRQIEQMKQHNVEVSLTHYETILAGRALDVFNGLEKVFTETDKAGSAHTIMTVTISANSPSLDADEGE